MRTLSRRTKAGAATLGLAVAVAVVAMAATSPLSRSTPVNARAAQGPTTALFMVLAGTGLVMLGAIALVAFGGRRRQDDLPGHEATRNELPWIWKVVATALPFALGAAVLGAALSGTRSGHNGARSPGAIVGAASSGAGRSTGAKAGFAVPDWLPWTVLGIAVVALVAVAVVLWMRRQRPGNEPAASSAPRVAVSAAIDALDDEADPRRAVIAAYWAMQRALGERGVVRPPAEAPREYLERVLLATRASEGEARTLTRLFEEARYSTHPVSERLRQTALSALRSLQDRLQTDVAR